MGTKKLQKQSKLLPKSKLNYHSYFIRIQIIILNVDL